MNFRLNFIGSENGVKISVDLTKLGYPKGITQHIHLQIRVNGEWVDPTEYFFQK